MSDLKPLFQHIPHPHKPKNVNAIHDAEQRAEGINTAIAIRLTKSVGSMWTAYTFVVLAVVGLLAILGILSPVVALLVAWTSQTLIQLVLLPVIMVGQNVLSRKSEIMAEEMFATTQHSFSDIEQIMLHLDAQDKQILDMASKVEQMEKIEATEVLKHGDILVELLALVKEHDPLLKALSATPKGRGKA